MLSVFGSPSRPRRTPAPSDFESIFSNNSKRRCFRHPNIPTCQRCFSRQCTILRHLALGYTLTMPHLCWIRDRRLIPQTTNVPSPLTTSLQDIRPLRHTSPVLRPPRVSKTFPPPRLACSIWLIRLHHACLFNQRHTRRQTARAVQTATSILSTMSLTMKLKCLFMHQRQSRSLRRSQSGGATHRLSFLHRLRGPPLRS